MTKIKTNFERRILIIDDNPKIHDDFRKILAAAELTTDMSKAYADVFGDIVEKPDYVNADLSHASQGREGLAICKSAVESGQPFAVAFVDMRMPPGWNGLKTISELWKVDPNLQVVICSAYSDHSWSQIHEELGSTDRLLILKKPFDNAEVLQLASALTKKRELIELATTRTERLEAMVEERTQHYREAKRDTDLLISAIDSMLVALDTNNTINLWNSQSEALFGLRRSDAIGHGFMDLPIDWEDASGVEHAINTHGKRFEAAYHDRSGEPKIVGMSSFEVSDQGVYKGNLIIGTNLTENRALESQLHQAQKLEAVGQLAAGVAHEINTPMQYLGDNLDYLDKRVGLLAPLLDSLESLGDVNDDMTAETLSDFQARLKKN